MRFNAVARIGKALSDAGVYDEMTKTQQKETKPETLPIMTYPAAWGEMHGKKAEKALPILLVPFKVIKNPMGYMFWTRELGGSVFFRQTDTPHYDTLRAAQPKEVFCRCGDSFSELSKCANCSFCDEKDAEREGMAQGKEAVLNSFESWFKGAQMLPNYDVCKNGLGLVALIRRGDYSIHTLEGKKAKK